MLSFLQFFNEVRISIESAKLAESDHPVSYIDREERFSESGRALFAGHFVDFVHRFTCNSNADYLIKASLAIEAI